MRQSPFQFSLLRLVQLTTAAAFMLALAAQSATAAWVIGVLVAPTALFGLMMLILIFAPQAPFQRQATRDAPPHQFFDIHRRR